MRRQRVLLIAAVVAVAVGSAVWRCRGAGETHPHKDRSMYRARRVTLDPEKARAQRRLLLERATRIQAARAAGVRSEHERVGRDGAIDPAKKRILPGFIDDLLSPCILGPAELCDMVTDLALDCENADARACLAAGQLLTETPPHAFVAISLFYLACKHGDAEGCARLEEIKSGTKSCDEDLFGCAHRAFRDNDGARLDEACVRGVSDACAMMMSKVEDDHDLSRAYLEQGCQHGSPMMCQELGRRLAPACTSTEFMPCYPPDPTQAAAANLIACEAGWTDACK